MRRWHFRYSSLLSIPSSDHMSGRGSEISPLTHSLIERSRQRKIARGRWFPVETFNSDFSSVMFAPFVCGTGGAKYPVTARDVFPSLFPHYFLPLSLSPAVDVLPNRRGRPIIPPRKNGESAKKIGRIQAHQSNLCMPGDHSRIVAN